MDAETAMRKQAYVKAHAVICQSLNETDLNSDAIPNKFLASLEQTITAALIETHLAVPRRIAELEAENKALRQSLIGGIEAVRSGRDMMQWAEANEMMLGKGHRD